MPRNNEPRFVLTDHACRECGGRILQQVNSGVTGGGNPVYRCADCGIGGASMGPQRICWCGMKHRGIDAEPYTCINVGLAETDAAIKEVLMLMGYLFARRPKNEIAVVPRGMLRAAKERQGNGE